MSPSPVSTALWFTSRRQLIVWRLVVVLSVVAATIAAVPNQAAAELLAPSNVRTTWRTATEVAVEWDYHGNDHGGFELRATRNQQAQSTNTSGRDTRWQTLGQLDRNVDYCVEVRAVGSAPSAWASTGSCGSGGDPNEPPPPGSPVPEGDLRAPSAPDIEWRTGTEIAMTWSYDGSDHERFDLRVTLDDGSVISSASSGRDTRWQKLNGVDQRQSSRYCYEVQAVGANGASSWASTGSCPTPRTGPGDDGDDPDIRGFSNFVAANYYEHYSCYPSRGIVSSTAALDNAVIVRWSAETMSDDWGFAVRVDDDGPWVTEFVQHHYETHSRCTSLIDGMRVLATSENTGGRLRADREICFSVWAVRKDDPNMSNPVLVAGGESHCATPHRVGYESNPGANEPPSMFLTEGNVITRNEWWPVDAVERHTLFERTWRTMPEEKIGSIDDHLMPSLLAQTWDNLDTADILESCAIGTAVYNDDVRWCAANAITGVVTAMNGSTGGELDTPLLESLATCLGGLVSYRVATPDNFSSGSVIVRSAVRSCVIAMAKLDAPVEVALTPGEWVENQLGLIFWSAASRIYFGPVGIAQGAIAGLFDSLFSLDEVPDVPECVRFWYRFGEYLDGQTFTSSQVGAVEALNRRIRGYQLGDQGGLECRLGGGYRALTDNQAWDLALALDGLNLTDEQLEHRDHRLDDPTFGETGGRPKPRTGWYYINLAVAETDLTDGLPKMPGRSFDVDARYDGEQIAIALRDVNLPDDSYLVEIEPRSGGGLTTASITIENGEGTVSVTTSNWPANELGGRLGAIKFLASTSLTDDAFLSTDFVVNGDNPDPDPDPVPDPDPIPDPTPTPDPDPPTPTPLPNIAAPNAVWNGLLSVTWTYGDNGQSNFQIGVSVDGQETIQTASGSGARQYTAQGLDIAKDHRVRVRAFRVNAGGSTTYSAWSPTITVPGQQGTGGQVINADASRTQTSYTGVTGQDIRITLDGSASTGPVDSDDHVWWYVGNDEPVFQARGTTFSLDVDYDFYREGGTLEYALAICRGLVSDDDAKANCRPDGWAEPSPPANVDTVNVEVGWPESLTAEISIGDSWITTSRGREKIRRADGQPTAIAPGEIAEVEILVRHPGGASWYRNSMGLGSNLDNAPGESNELVWTESPNARCSPEENFFSGARAYLGLCYPRSAGQAEYFRFRVQAPASNDGTLRLALRMRDDDRGFSFGETEIVQFVVQN